MSQHFDGIVAPAPARRGGAVLLRGWFVAAAATVPAAALHGLAHGAQPSLAVVLVALVLAAALAVPLVGRRWSRWRSAAAVTLSQLCFHLIFAIDGGLHGVSAHSGHHHSVEETAAQIRTGLASASAPAASIPDHGAGWMLVAHLVAALFSTLLFWYGYDCIMRVASWAHGVAVRVWDALAPVQIGVIRLLSLRQYVSFRRPLAIAQWIIRTRRGRAPPVLV